MATRRPSDPGPLPHARRRPPRAVRRRGGARAVLVAQGALIPARPGARQTTTEVDTYTGVRALVIDDASDVRLTSGRPASALEVRARVTEGLPRRSAVRRGGDGTLGSRPPAPASSRQLRRRLRDPCSRPGPRSARRSSAGDVSRGGPGADRAGRAGVLGGRHHRARRQPPELRLAPAPATSTRRRAADDVNADSSAGDVSLSLRTPARPRRRRSSAGDVELVLPDATYRVDASQRRPATSTTARSAPTRPGSPRVASARSSAGDVRIEARGGGGGGGAGGGGGGGGARGPPAAPPPAACSPATGAIATMRSIGTARARRSRPAPARPAGPRAARRAAWAA